MKTEILTITPEMAKMILERSQLPQRHLRQSHIEFLAYQMKTGKWKFTGEPLIFNDEVGLIDGQHRLHALIKANITLDFVVIRGISKDVFSVLDTGITRSAGDVLDHTGVKHGAKIATIIRGYLLIKNANYYGGGRAGEASSVHSAYKKLTTNEDVLNIFNEKPDYWIEVKKKCHVWYDAYKRLLSVLQFAPLYAIFQERTGDLADEFFNKLCHLRFSEEKNDPLRKLTASLMLNSTNNKKYHTRIIRALIIKTWNAFYKGELIGQLRYNENDQYPEILP